MTQRNDFLEFPDADNRKEEIIRELKSDPGLYGRYLSMGGEWKERFIGFCQGRKTLPLTYDPFFKMIFHPDIHPDRLSRLISSLLGIQVKVIRTLPAEETLLGGGALMIMDILVELEDGALANVEIQKIPYAFPGERISCYSSDLVLRQYSRVKGEKGASFTYRNLKKVYTIVIFEQSTDVFHKLPDKYIHRGRTTFDTGLELELLQEYYLVALDVFRKLPYPKVRSEQTAWLSLLAAEDVWEAEALVGEYPWVEEVYEEIAGLMHKPKEVLNMFSDALRILDRNTVQYMIEEQKKEIEKQKKELEEAEKAREEIEKEKAQAEKEREEVEKRKAEAEKERAEAEKERAEAEKERAEAEKRKAEAEKQRAEAEKQKKEAEDRAQQMEQLLKEKEAQIAELMKRLEVEK